ncbi:hypothetical protein D3C85_1653040 [compost metagenome]
MEVRLAGKITGKQQAGTDLVLIQELEQVDTIDPGAFLQGDWEAKPGWVAIWGWFGDFKEIAQARQAFLEQLEVALASFNELGCAVELCQAASRLHVGDLQVVA